jgi:hypothetical protein
MKPCVLASLERWNPTTDQVLAIRDRLRALNAQLIVMSNVGTAVITPTHGEVLVEAPEALARKSGLELSVINADGSTRTYECLPFNGEGPEEALLTALGEVKFSS